MLLLLSYCKAKYTQYPNEISKSAVAMLYSPNTYA